MNTAASESVIERMVKPISPAPVNRRLERLLAGLDVTDDVLDHHDGVVDEKADGDGEAHQRQVVDAVAQ